MLDSKVITTPLSQHYNISTSESPTDEAEKKHMTVIPYASEVGSIMEWSVVDQTSLMP